MSSNPDVASAMQVPVTILQYRDIASPLAFDSSSSRELARESAEIVQDLRAEVQLSEAEFSARIKLEREQAVRETEMMLRREYEAKLSTANAAVAAALKGLNEQRNDYFTRVEAEVVQLALSIAAKILHREAQVDPMLVAALVRIAIERMREGSHVTIRVSPARAASWKSYFASISNLTQVEIVADEQVNESDCMVETELGAANFGLEKQLKEVEQGFFDLLALRPAKS